MACKCKNQDGTPSQLCTGMCKLEVIKEQQLQQERDPLNGFAELVMGQVNKLMDNRFNEFQVRTDKEFMANYQKFFLEGFKQGFKFAREGDEYDE